MAVPALPPAPGTAPGPAHRAGAPLSRSCGPGVPGPGGPRCSGGGGSARGRRRSEAEVGRGLSRAGRRRSFKRRSAYRLRRLLPAPRGAEQRRRLARLPGRDGTGGAPAGTERGGRPGALAAVARGRGLLRPAGAASRRAGALTPRSLFVLSPYRRGAGIRRRHAGQEAQEKPSGQGPGSRGGEAGEEGEGPGVLRVGQPARTSLLSCGRLGTTSSCLSVVFLLLPLVRSS